MFACGFLQSTFVILYLVRMNWMKAAIEVCIQRDIFTFANCLILLLYGYMSRHCSSSRLKSERECVRAWVAQVSKIFSTGKEKRIHVSFTAQASLDYIIYSVYVYVYSTIQFGHTSSLNSMRIIYMYVFVCIQVPNQMFQGSHQRKHGPQ